MCDGKQKNGPATVAEIAPCARTDKRRRPTQRMILGSVGVANKPTSQPFKSVFSDVLQPNLQFEAVAQYDSFSQSAFVDQNEAPFAIPPVRLWCSESLCRYPIDINAQQRLYRCANGQTAALSNSATAICRYMTDDALQKHCRLSFSGDPSDRNSANLCVRSTVGRRTTAARPGKTLAKSGRA